MRSSGSLFRRGRPRHPRPAAEGGLGARRLRRAAGSAATLLALTVTAVVTGVVLQASPASANDLTDRRLVTYNMQGAGTRWTTEIPRLAQGRDVVLLQEAGPAPSFMNLMEVIFNPLGDVRHYTWTSGNLARGGTLFHVYWMQTDRGGNRVNLAMVTRETPSRVLFVPPAPGIGVGRPMFGLQIGNTAFFTIHALSGGGGDAADLLAGAEALARSNGLGWVVAGDFNRDPDTLSGRLPVGSYIERTRRATQQSGGELDYMVTNVPTFGSYQARRLDALGSDHYPVEFQTVGGNPSGGNGTNPNTRPGSIPVSSLLPINSGSGLTPRSDVAGVEFALTTESAGTAYTLTGTETPEQDGLNLSRTVDRGAGDQWWRVSSYRSEDGSVNLVNRGECLEAVRAPAAVRTVITRPCDERAAQRWKGLTSPESSRFELRNVETGECVGADTTLTGPSIRGTIVECGNGRFVWAMQTRSGDTVTTGSAAGFEWKDAATSKCLDANLGAKVYTLGCNGGDFQRWTAEPAPSGVFLKHDRTGLCLAGDSANDDVRLTTCNGESLLQWAVSWDDRGVEFRNAAKGSCLDSNADGDLYAIGCNGGDFQRWRVG